MKNKPITKQLSNKFGGEWKYTPFQSIWSCDEMRLTAYYVAEGGYDMDGNYKPVHKAFRRITIFGLKSGIDHLYTN